jgi:hypothetical protein
MGMMFLLVQRTPFLGMMMTDIVCHRIKVFIADRDQDGAQKVVDALNKDSQVAKCAHLDAASWNSQAKAFSQAVADFGRIDYVYPIAGIGERVSIPNDPQATGFQMPDLTVLDVDLTGVLYTVSLAVQQFRRQEPGSNGLRGQSKWISPYIVIASTDVCSSWLCCKRVWVLLLPNFAHIHCRQTCDSRSGAKLWEILARREDHHECHLSECDPHEYFHWAVL